MLQLGAQRHSNELAIEPPLLQTALHQVFKKPLSYYSSALARLLKQALRLATSRVFYEVLHSTHYTTHKCR